MNNSAQASRHSVPSSEVVTALRRIESSVVVPGPFAIGQEFNSRNARQSELNLDTVIRDIADLRIAVRHAFIEASPEYQLLIELSDNGLRDCAKCVRELEARAAQHPYNKMLTKIDVAYDAAVRSTRAGVKP
jgi:hypothetical protein